MSNAKQTEQMREGNGFIAALDQSGGSTPKALRLYGIEEDAYNSEDEMFDLIHQMRSRIIKSPAFTGEKVVGAILFEQTMDRDIDGTPTATYLWEKRGVVPFLKIDKGLEAEEHGVQLMKPIPNLDALLERAVKAGIFGTKERSVISAANVGGIKAIVDQQFELGMQVLSHGLVPILEPEVTISISDKDEAEQMLLAEILSHLDAVPEGKQVMLKLSLPTEPNRYKPLVDHPKVLKVVALSGGYSRDEANEKLAKNTGMIASFSRALTEGLSAQQSDEEFNAMLEDAITSIHAASVAG
ncbi:MULTISPECIES: fructose bisphosphate aldolase [unclassified Thioclava]|uniref:fructose bisphosphate aldolase n=1 Tax=unclassified Thioclava TaxID=2621713 RepID=UPI000B540F40|nr:MULTISPECIES: fructose bisphosphate aldolase [unclassified Thioclava]OWY04814.1 fructose bisphosphate aldolase [Thioclava sp. F1Mire-8]OWY06431.1 fructose bisphosphate aldolase [Thioclava sp. IC9]OWY08040.1 fructose bisphosphate aldolase [Thioclava sp. F42-5]OWY18654.1 fructose bisphosphate aldolase [Thioclava sp. JM3]PWE50658.1 fructose bisphosphate aldolase [Thioclava sp. NG1]